MVKTAMATGGKGLMFGKTPSLGEKGRDEGVLTPTISQSV